MLSFMTLNLRFGLADDGPNNWSRRRKAYPLLFGKYRPDFIAFQEANDFQGDFLRELLKGYGVLGIRSPAPRFWQNNLIFHRKNWRCVHGERFFLSHVPDIPSRFRDSRWPRQCTVGIFEKEGRRIMCVNTHLDFAAHVQTAAAEVIMERLSRLPSDMPTILAGDFNAPPSRPCFRVFTEAPHRFGAKMPFRSVFRDPFPGTFHGFTGRPDARHIDWILWRGGLRPENAEVIRDAFGGIHPSDHFPVRAVFRYEA